MAFNKFKKIDIPNIELYNDLFDKILSTIVNIYYDDDSFVKSAFDQLSSEDYINGFFQKMKISHMVKNAERISPEKEKFMNLTPMGKLKLILLIIERYFDKQYIESIIGDFEDYLNKCEEKGLLNFVDQEVLSLITRNKEFGTILGEKLRYSSAYLPNTYKYLLDHNLITKEEAFDERSIRRMDERQKGFVIDNIDPCNLKNIIYFDTIYRRNTQGKNKLKMYNQVKAIPLTNNIDEAYEEVTKIEGYPPYLSVIDAFKKNGINISEEEKKFLVYLTFSQYKFQNSSDKNIIKDCMFNDNLISKIIEVAQVKGGFKEIIKIFQLFKEIETINYGFIRDSLNFCVAYSNKPIFSELSNIDVESLTPSLINKLILLSRNSAYKEINTLDDLIKLNTADMSNLTIDSSKKSGEMLGVRYHPFLKGSKRKDRSLIIIDANGNVVRKSVNGHHIGLHELYGIYDSTHLRQISRCVRVKNDIIIVSADEFVEVLFNDEITKEQCYALLDVLSKIGKSATYMVGVCNSDFTVNSASKGEEDAMDYETVINTISSIDFIKEKMLEEDQKVM